MNELNYRPTEGGPEARTSLGAQRAIALSVLLFGLYTVGHAVVSHLAEWATPWNFVSFNSIAGHVGTVAALVAIAGGVLMLRQLFAGWHIAFWATFAYLAINASMWIERSVRAGSPFHGTDTLSYLCNMMGSLAYLLCPVSLLFLLSRACRNAIRPERLDRAHEPLAQRARIAIATIVLVYGTYYTTISLETWRWLYSSGTSFPQREPLDFSIAFGTSIASAGIMVSGAMIVGRLRGGALVSIAMLGLFLGFHVLGWREYLVPGLPRFGGTQLVTRVSQAISSLRYLITPVILLLIVASPLRRVTCIR